MSIITFLPRARSPDHLLRRSTPDLPLAASIRWLGATMRPSAGTRKDCSHRRAQRLTQRTVPLSPGLMLHPRHSRLAPSRRPRRTSRTGPTRRSMDRLDRHTSRVPTSTSSTPPKVSPPRLSEDNNLGTPVQIRRIRTLVMLILSASNLFTMSLRPSCTRQLSPSLTKCLPLSSTLQPSRCNKPLLPLFTLQLGLFRRSLPLLCTLQLNPQLSP
jgi:hypothetical protein